MPNLVLEKEVIAKENVEELLGKRPGDKKKKKKEEKAEADPAEALTESTPEAEAPASEEINTEKTTEDTNKPAAAEEADTSNDEAATKEV